VIFTKEFKYNYFFGNKKQDKTMSVVTDFYGLCTTYLVFASYMEQGSRFESGARELETGSDNKGVYRGLIRKNKRAKKNHLFHMKETWESLQTILGEFNNTLSNSMADCQRSSNNYPSYLGTVETIKC
jgi:hypothetical protein